MLVPSPLTVGRDTTGLGLDGYPAVYDRNQGSVISGRRHWPAHPGELKICRVIAALAVQHNTPAGPITTLRAARTSRPFPTSRARAHHCRSFS